MKPIISIVGRPNVGKSTFFNRIIGYRKAIIEDSPGVTRDRNYGEFEFDGNNFILVDTGGFEPSSEDSIFRLVKEQIHVSMEESTAIIFILDGKDGLLPQDKEIATDLRKHDKPVIYVINKVDSNKTETASAEFYELGVEKIFTISALHGIGIGELLDEICDVVNNQGFQPSPEAEPTSGIRIAIVGKPNTGKSSITNKLLGSQRMIVSDIPGTTRDSIDSKILYKDNEVILIDTAGLRRKSKVSVKVEEHSVSSAIHSIDRANIINLIIDAQEGVTHQDAGIAHTVVSRGKGLCIVVNKWDLVKGEMDTKVYKKMVLEKLPHASFSPVIFVSAVTGLNIGGIIDTDLRIHGQMEKEIGTPKLNKAIEESIQRVSLPHVQGKQLKIFYASQTKTSPPTFMLFSNYPKFIPEHYKRYLENSLRDKFSFMGAPIRLVFRKK
ncbi:MAG: ribosome biogenesis GTPase Der [Proteobacteria bacterium]|nr:ribosome biogenesis GTPase Der [Pseudomonadota bacterium]